MIDKVTIDGVLLDPCLVLAQVTVIHGRGGFTDTGRPSSATIQVEVRAGPMPTIGQSGQTLLLDGPDGRMFAGRIVERSLEHFTDSDGSKWGRFTVTAAGSLAALGYRVVGDTPWPEEPGVTRAARILGSSGVRTWRVEGETDLLVLARDVDSQPAGGLLDELASWTSAAIFDTPDGAVVYQALASRTRIKPWMWSDTPDAYTWGTLDPALSWDGPPPSIGDWDSPTSGVPVVLPCDAVLWEPAWTSSESDVINHVRVSYGAADPQDAVDVADNASIVAHNRRDWVLDTGLATLADAIAAAAHVLSTRAVERWELDEVTVDLALLDAPTRAAVLGLVCGDTVIVAGLPQPAPAIDWSGIVEGWTFNQSAEGSTVVGQMVLALSDPMRSLVVPAWEDFTGVYTWANFPAGTTWDHLDKLPA